MDKGVAWGVFTAKEYRDIIARPGDDMRSPGLDTGLNKAEGKMKEALQLFSKKDSGGGLYVRGGRPPCSRCGGGAGGWTGHMAKLQNKKVGVIAIDPASLCPTVSSLENVVHLKDKAEQVSHNQGDILAEAANKLVGESWRDKLRLLMCDANLDIRDSLRELVLPFLPFLCSMLWGCGRGDGEAGQEGGRDRGGEEVRDHQEAPAGVWIQGGIHQVPVTLF